MATTQGSLSAYWGLSSAGTRDGGIDGVPYGSNIGIAGFKDYAYNVFKNGVTDSTGKVLYPAADKGFWKAKTLTDPSIFDFYNKLIDGPNKKEWQNWDAYNIVLSQTFLNNRVGFELVYDRQIYNDGQTRNINNPFISVDIRSHLMRYPWAYTGNVVANPNAGRAYVGSSTKNGGNSANFSDRENFRGTLYGEVRASDFLGKNLLSNILGRHSFTGLLSREIYQVETRNWVRYALDNSWCDVTGSGNLGGLGTDMSGSGTGGLVTADNVIDWMSYLSGNLAGKTSAKGLNLDGITAVQSPTGSYNISYFDSHWANSSVNPSDPWFNPTGNLIWDAATETAVADPTKMSTQSENPLNYKGWTTQSFTVLNADNGDIDRLYTDVSNVQKKTTSKAITWQGFFWDDTIVGTWGIRHDEQQIRSGSSVAAALGTASINPALDPLDRELGVSKGNSISWGAVVKTPKFLREKLPWGTNFSLTYSNGRNTRVENRYSFNGNVLPNAKGLTKDIGFVVSTLDDKLQFKVTRYQTTVNDANISSVTTEASTLGNNTYYLRNLEGWGTASAMLDLAGRAGAAPGWEWYWNWALVDNGWDGKYNDPKGTDFLNAAATAKQTAAINSWLAQMQPQSWFDAYGFAVDVAKVKKGDWSGISGWTPTSGVGGLQPSGGGRIRGTWPTGTVDNESKGWEFEIVGNPVKGLNISINAAKTHAAQTKLGTDLITFIEAQHAKYMSPAGDLRLWWGGDATLREVYNNNIWAAYQFQLQTNGKMMPEMSPWRVNSVINYSFDQGTFLKGANVGLGYRWQDRRILGYQLNAALDNLDVNKPYWSKTEESFDFWVGYDHKLTDKINWRIQLNLRNVAEKAKLVPISIQPDGTNAAFRIKEGMTWTLTNTFSF